MGLSDGQVTYANMKFCFSQNTFFLILTFGIRSIRSPAKVGIGYYKAVKLPAR